MLLACKSYNYPRGPSLREVGCSDPIAAPKYEIEIQLLLISSQYRTPYILVSVLLSLSFIRALQDAYLSCVHADVLLNCDRCRGNPILFTDMPPSIGRQLSPRRRSGDRGNLGGGYMAADGLRRIPLRRWNDPPTSCTARGHRHRYIGNPAFRGAECTYCHCDRYVCPIVFG